MKEPVHIEVTSKEGASKWIREIVSHSIKQILDAWERGDETIRLSDVDGAETVVDLSDTYMIRAQNDEVFKRRSEYVRKS
jgi:hypothetical protein